MLRTGTSKQITEEKIFTNSQITNSYLGNGNATR